MNFSQLYLLYLERHVTANVKCPRNVHSFWKMHGPYWSDIEVDSVTGIQVQDWFDLAASKSKSSALRAINTLCAMVNWGLRRGYSKNNNPCKNIEKVKLKARERFLLPDEITRFKISLAKEPQDIQDLFWLCLVTGARRGNILSMSWSEIDITLALWRIPPEKHKNGESHLVPLTEASLVVLSRRKQIADIEVDYVFPSYGVTGHMGDPKRAWKRILKRANIRNLRIHDLRRTLGSYLAIKGESPYMIGKVLGHIDPRSTAIYARLNLAPVRIAMENAQTTFV